MDPRFTVFNGSTVVFVAITVWVLSVRIRGVVDSNWPLFYYVAVVAYSAVFPGYLDPAFVYAGVVCALLLRFEFMGGFFLKIVRVIEIIVLAYYAYAAISAMTFFL